MSAVAPTENDGESRAASSQTGQPQQLLPAYSCRKCCLKFQLVDDFENHMMVQHSAISYNCSLCASVASDRKTLGKHFLKAHCDFAAAPTDQASENVSSSSDANCQARLAASNTPAAPGAADSLERAQCPKCALTGFITRAHLNSHLHQFHKWLPCFMCLTEVFESPGDLERHIRNNCKHNAPSFQQSTPLKTSLAPGLPVLPTLPDVSTIQQQYPNLWNPYAAQQMHPCHFCGRTFANVTELQVHTLASHVPPAPTMFPNLTAPNLAPPMVLGNAPMAFPVPTSFNQASMAASFALLKGANSEAPMVRTTPAFPANAGDGISQGGNWKKNLAKAEPLPGQLVDYSKPAAESASSSLKPSSSQPQQQPSSMKEMALQCIAELSSRRGFSAANRSPNKDPNRCKLCQRTLSSSFSLMCHYRSHAGIKPYSCSVCGARFTQQNSLSYHLLIHQNLKPFSCDKCNRSYRNKQLYKKHLRQHESGGSAKKAADGCSQMGRDKNESNDSGWQEASVAGDD